MVEKNINSEHRITTMSDSEKKARYWGIAISILTHIIILIIFAYIVWDKPFSIPATPIQAEIISGEDVSTSLTSIASQISVPQISKKSSLSASIPELVDIGLEQIDITQQSLENQPLLGLKASISESMSLSNENWNEILQSSKADSFSSVNFFGLAGTGGNLIYIVDCSGSMQGSSESPLNTAKSELQRSIMSLSNETKFNIIFFNDRTTQLSSSLIKANETNKSKAIQWIEKITASGGTNPKPAFMEALKMKPDTIWFLTDGRFPEGVADEVKDGNPRGRIKINTIAFFNDSGQPVLIKIAKENRGKFRYISK